MPKRRQWNMILHDMFHQIAALKKQIDDLAANADKLILQNSKNRSTDIFDKKGNML